MTAGQLLPLLIIGAVVILFIRSRTTDEPWTANRILRWALGLWAVAFPVMSCSPMLIGGSSTGAAAATGLGSLVLGAVLFFPWIVGVIVLGVLVLITR